MDGAPPAESRTRWIPAAAFLVGTALHWPVTLWFRDEAGYIGQARLLLSGRLRPDATSVLHAWATPSGQIAEYPFPYPALLALPFAVTPRAVFAVVVGSALILGWSASKKLSAWGRAPGWGFGVLLCPSVLLFSRTAMADIPLAAASMLAWLALERDRPWEKAAAIAAVVLLKPIGLVLAAGLIAGEIVRRMTGDASRPLRTTARQLAPAAAGMIAGLGVHLVLNRAATGAYWFAYAHSAEGFAWSHFATSGVAHLKSLLLSPPLLLAGAIPLWRRREYGALFAAALLIGLMGCFSFVDAGRNAFESLIVSPRLILPAVVILLTGWVDGVAGFAERVLPRRVVPWVLAASLFTASFLAGAALAPKDRARQSALAGAEAALHARRGRILGLGDAAFEAGLLAKAPVVWAAPGGREADVVLCADITESRRPEVRSHSCELPGYAPLGESGGYRLLGRVETEPP